MLPVMVGVRVAGLPWPPEAGVALLQPRVKPAASPDDIVTSPPGAKGTTLQPHDPR